MPPSLGPHSLTSLTPKPPGPTTKNPSFKSSGGNDAAVVVVGHLVSGRMTSVSDCPHGGAESADVPPGCGRVHSRIAAPGKLRPQWGCSPSPSSWGLAGEGRHWRKRPGGESAKPGARLTTPSFRQPPTRLQRRFQNIMWVPRPALGVWVEAPPTPPRRALPPPTTRGAHHPGLRRRSTTAPPGPNVLGLRLCPVC